MTLLLHGAGDRIDVCPINLAAGRSRNGTAFKWHDKGACVNATSSQYWRHKRDFNMIS
jgi:hypothetical protein